MTIQITVKIRVDTMYKKNGEITLIALYLNLDILL
jgi:hypothetical protein